MRAKMINDVSVSSGVSGKTVPIMMCVSLDIYKGKITCVNIGELYKYNIEGVGVDTRVSTERVDPLERK
jgi:hypothetical protein